MLRRDFVKNGAVSGIGLSLAGNSIAALLNSPSFTFGLHPRLFFSKGEETAILRKAKHNTLLAQLIAVLKKEADKKLTVSPQVYKPNTVLLAISREQINRIVTLAMAYRLFNNKVYAKKVEEELVNVCSFDAWHPEHFLDVAEMTTAVAIGYDWCYDFLSLATRQTVEKAIREKAFAPAWPIYKSGDKNSPFSRDTNWNMVCNSGMVNGAIAIGDKYPEDAKDIIQYAVKNTPNILQIFAPEGVCNEGPAYWSYNGIYMALFFDNLKRNVHDHLELTQYKGLDNTARFYMSLVGPSKQTFNYADASGEIDYNGTFFFLSRYYRQPEVAAFYRNLLTAALKEYAHAGHFGFPRYFFLSIPWFDNATLSKPQGEYKLDIFNGITDIVVLNGKSNDDNNRLYLAAKTGRPNWPHNQLDVGTFVVDSEGQRWGVDLGADDYDLPGFWDYKPGGQRWNYFRNTNLAHNTLSIDNKLSNPEGQGELIRSNKNNTNPYAIFDMTSSYQEQASSVLRGFKLLSPDTILIRDEVILKPDGNKVAWRFLTNADVKIEANRAILSQSGKSFYINCLLGDDFAMSVIKAKPNTSAEKPIEGVYIIEITVTPTNKVAVIPVLMGNRLTNLNDSAAGNLPLDNWK